MYTGRMDQHDDDIKGQMVECPKCASRMARYTHGGISVDRCPTCAGLWLDALELERLLDAPAEASEFDRDSSARQHRADTRQSISCPRDKSPMVAMSDVRQPHVSYEKCTVCGGVFLDAGELRDLAEFTLVERIRSMLG